MEKEQLITEEQVVVEQVTEDVVQTLSLQATGRRTERIPEDKKNLLNRLKRIEGQVRGVRRMIENDLYVTDVLIQSMAVASAVNSFNREIIASHINSCTIDYLELGEEEFATQELMMLVQRISK